MLELEYAGSSLTSTVYRPPQSFEAEQPAAPFEAGGHA
jgi:hypothetical protein